MALTLWPLLQGHTGVMLAICVDLLRHQLRFLVRYGRRKQEEMGKRVVKST